MKETDWGIQLGEAFRRATRPAVTIICMGTIAQVVVEKIAAPQWFTGMAVTIVLFWFGERSVKSIKGRANDE